MRPRLNLCALALSLLLSFSFAPKAEAGLGTSVSKVCQNLLTLFHPSNHHASLPVQLTPPILSLEKIKQELENASGKKPRDISALATAFVQAYQYEASQISTFEDAQKFFSLVGDVLAVEDADHVFHVTHATTSPRSLLWQIFKFNHTDLFRRLKPVLTPSQAQQLRETIYSVRSDADSNPHHVSVRRLWWKVIWLYDLVLEPEITLQNLINGLEQKAFFYDQSGKVVHNIDFKGILLHSSDVIDAFSALSADLKAQARRQIIEKHYMIEKHKDALAILQGLNHEHLRALAQKLKQLRSNNELNVSTVTDAIDSYWRRIGHLDGYHLKGYKPRGGYGFADVLKPLEGMGESFEQHVGRGKSFLLFGSYPNGLAHVERLENGKTRFDSDLDMTFSNSTQFRQEALINFHNQHWLNAKDTKSPRYKALVALEKIFAKNMNLEKLKKGSIVSSLSQFTYESILNAKDFSGSTYVMLASPIALEVTAKTLTLHLHYLPEGALEPITEGFSFSNLN